MPLRLKVLLAVTIAVVVADQGSKIWAVHALTPALDSLTVAEFYGLTDDAFEHPCDAAYCPGIAVIEGYWSFRYVENPGAAWGMLSKADPAVRGPFFMVISIVAMLMILWFLKSIEADQKLLMFGLSLVFGGAIGNFIDRVHLSYVIDFIDWHVGRHHWPTFNVADAAISVGVGLLVLDWAREAVQTRNDSPADAVASAD